VSASGGWSNGAMPGDFEYIKGNEQIPMSLKQVNENVTAI
jgi:hypothetical protein